MQIAVPLALTIVWVALAILGDMQFKAAPAMLSFRFGAGCLFYLACSFVALPAFRQQSWGWIFVVWNCLSLACGLALSLAIYGEPMTWRRAVAAALLFAAIFLVE